MDTFSNFFKEQREKEEKEDKEIKEGIKKVILGYINFYGKKRQRQDLYDYLNEYYKYYDLNLTAYDYDGRKDHAKVALQSEKWEYDYVVNKVFKELKKKI
ncbi:hypothetical protein [Campylobacter ureolyticus]|uniref:hypothetical protein n=1 Tax=Campylobacter ureolyticus TaxID=827 RepID=UPI0022B31CBC|nr:hypothetical protein [Campylobacter ureolyticus]MCZ6116602.1 hypothetical protein [Campylobacter ureolyticus]